MWEYFEGCTLHYTYRIQQIILYLGLLVFKTKVVSVNSDIYL